MLAAPLFDRDTGVLYVGDEESFRSFGWNLAGLLVMIVWTAVLAFFIFGLMKFFGYLRVSEEVELKGELRRSGLFRKVDYFCCGYHTKF